jgi:hypothetical protein
VKPLTISFRSGVRNVQVVDDQGIRISPFNAYLIKTRHCLNNMARPIPRRRMPTVKFNVFAEVLLANIEENHAPAVAEQTRVIRMVRSGLPPMMKPMTVPLKMAVHT